MVLSVCFFPQQCPVVIIIIIIIIKIIISQYFEIGSFLTTTPPTKTYSVILNVLFYEHTTMTLIGKTQLEQKVPTFMQL